MHASVTLAAFDVFVVCCEPVLLFFSRCSIFLFFSFFFFYVDDMGTKHNKIYLEGNAHTHFY